VKLESFHFMRAMPKAAMAPKKRLTARVTPQTRTEFNSAGPRRPSDQAWV